MCQYFGRNASLLIYDLSHNFAGYVVNAAGLEDIVVGRKLLVRFRHKILKIAFGSLRK